MPVDATASSCVLRPSSPNAPFAGATAVTHVLRVRGRTPRYFVVTEVPAHVVRDGPGHGTNTPCACRICAGLPDGVEVLCVEQTDLSGPGRDGRAEHDAAVTGP